MKMTKQAFQLNLGILITHVKDKLSTDFSYNVEKAQSRLIIELIGENAELKKRIDELEGLINKNQ